jgi:hypothetical protein
MMLDVTTVEETEYMNMFAHRNLFSVQYHRQGDSTETTRKEIMSVLGMKRGNHMSVVYELTG